MLERIAEHPITRIEELLPWNVDVEAHRAASTSVSAADPLGHIRVLIDGGGHIMIGREDPIDFAALGWDGRQTVAMPWRHSDETLPQLLNRLSLALDTARRQGQPVDEINE